MRKWHSRRDTRKIHRWGAFLVSIPFLVVIVTGIILQLKKEVEWIQPKTEEVAIDTLSIHSINILSIYVCSYGPMRISRVFQSEYSQIAKHRISSSKFSAKMGRSDLPGGSRPAGSGRKFAEAADVLF